jgi:hypothetical protein
MLMNRDQLLTLWKLEDISVCDKGMRLAQTFLEASGECVSNLSVSGHAATKSSGSAAPQQAGQWEQRQSLVPKSLDSALYKERKHHWR